MQRLPQYHCGNPQVECHNIHQVKQYDMHHTISDSSIQPTHRTSKSAPRVLPEKQRQERASTPMHRLPQYHRGNPQVECHNVYQVNQYDAPLSPQVFIPQDIHLVFSYLNIPSDKTKLQRVKIQFITTRV